MAPFTHTHTHTHTHTNTCVGTEEVPRKEEEEHWLNGMIARYPQRSLEVERKGRQHFVNAVHTWDLGEPALDYLSGISGRPVDSRSLVSGRKALCCWIEKEKKEDKEWARSESLTFREEVTEERVLGRVYVPRRSDAGGGET